MGLIVLDLKGLSCPLPILRTKKALKTLANDDILRVSFTDPSSFKDFEALCQEGADAVLESWNEDGGIYTLNLKRA